MDLNLRHLDYHHAVVSSTFSSTLPWFDRNKLPTVSENQERREASFLGHGWLITRDLAILTQDFLVEVCLHDSVTA